MAHMQAAPGTPRRATLGDTIARGTERHQAAPSGPRRVRRSELIRERSGSGRFIKLPAVTEHERLGQKQA